MAWLIIPKFQIPSNTQVMYSSYNFHIAASKPRYVFISQWGTGMIEKTRTWINAGYTLDDGCKWVKEFSVSNSASWTMVAAGNTVGGCEIPHQLIDGKHPITYRVSAILLVVDFATIHSKRVTDVYTWQHLGPWLRDTFFWCWTFKWISQQKLRLNIKCSHFLNIQMNVLGLFSFFQNNPIFYFWFGTLVLKLTISALKTTHVGLWYSNSLYQHLKLLTKCCALSITLRFREAQLIWAVADSRLWPVGTSIRSLNGHQWDLSGKNLRWHSKSENRINQGGKAMYRYPQLLTASQSSSSWTWENNRPSGCSQCSQ